MIEITCSGCGKIHELALDVSEGNFVLIRCSCGLTTKWYAETEIGG